MIQILCNCNFQVNVKKTKRCVDDFPSIFKYERKIKIWAENYKVEQHEILSRQVDVSQ